MPILTKRTWADEKVEIQGVGYYKDGLSLPCETILSSCSPVL